MRRWPSPCSSCSASLPSEKESYGVVEWDLGVPATLAELVERSQAYQSRFCRRTIEALRRKKYHHVNGLLQFLFVDHWPAITGSIIDYYRAPKPAYAAVAAAFSPVLLTFTFHPEAGAAAVWIINDYHRAIPGCTVRLSWGGVVEVPLVRSDSAEVVARVPIPVDGDRAPSWSGRTAPCSPAGRAKWNVRQLDNAEAAGKCPPLHSFIAQSSPAAGGYPPGTRAVPAPFGPMPASSRGLPQDIYGPCRELA